jgi:multiple sugar transport system permease protein
VIYALTGGGPANHTSLLSIEVYKTGFQQWNMGLAAAIGVFWFLTLSVPAFIYLKSIFKD